jgi:hypothetical protein
MQLGAGFDESRWPIPCFSPGLRRPATEVCRLSVDVRPLAFAADALFIASGGVEDVWRIELARLCGSEEGKPVPKTCPQHPRAESCPSKAAEEFGVIPAYF